MLTSKILPHRQKPVSMAELDPGLRGPQEILRTGQFVVPAKTGTRAVRGISGTIFCESLSAQFPAADIYLPSPRRGAQRPLPVSLSAPRGGEGRGEVGEARALADAHLTLPLRGPLPLPPEGRRGGSRNPGDRDARLSEAISVQSLSSPWTALRESGDLGANDSNPWAPAFRGNDGYKNERAKFRNRITGSSAGMTRENHVAAQAAAANGLRWSAIAFWNAGRASQRS